MDETEESFVQIYSELTVKPVELGLHRGYLKVAGSVARVVVVIVHFDEHLDLIHGRLAVVLRVVD